MKILVTGGNGFVGSKLVDQLLVQGHEVSSLARSEQIDLAQKGVSVFQGSLSDYSSVSQAVQGVRAVFHVAAKAGIWGSEDSYYKTNVEGTRNVIQACREHSVEKLIYTSTPSVVFNGQSFSGEDESLPYGKDWLCSYPKTKAIAEQEVLAANCQDFRVLALRPHLIWGNGDPHIIPRILKQARLGRLKRVGKGENKVDITHIDNVVHAHLLALEALINGHSGGKAYFISQGEPVNLWNWIDELLVLHSIAKLNQSISLSNAYIIGACLEYVYKFLRIKKEPPMTRFIAVELAKDHYYSMEAANKDLGYSPIVSIQEGLRKLIDTKEPTV